jgi:hypothetical protein
MEGLILLAEARNAGLTVQIDGSELVIKGPRRAAAVAKKLLRQKAAVVAALTIDQTAKDISARQAATAQCPPVTTEVGEEPTRITLAGEAFEVWKFVGMWFFRRQSDLGWTCCSLEFAAIIEARKRSVGPDVLARSKR